MSQLSKVNSSSSDRAELEPELRAVLEGLDVQLETELSRYRRYRRRTQGSDGGNNSAPPTQQPTEVNNQPSTVLGSVVVDEAAPLATRSPDNTDSTTHTTAPGDYLESSEQLIKSIDQNRPRRRRKRQPSLVASLFTPIGICSLLLFLISFAALGYVVTSSSEAENWSLNRWFGAKNTDNSPEETTDVIEPALPKSPNLATEEFVDLDIDTLSNINPNPNPIATFSPTPTPDPTNNNLTPPAPVPTGPDLGNMTNELIPEPTPVTPQPQPIQTPTPTAPGGAATRSQSQPIEAEDGYYYVVIDYQDAGSLETAQAAIADAYVREFKTGTKVQMGALEDAATARILAERLRVQGITVEFDVPK